MEIFNDLVVEETSTGKKVCSNLSFIVHFWTVGERLLSFGIMERWTRDWLREGRSEDLVPNGGGSMDPYADLARTCKIIGLWPTLGQERAHFVSFGNIRLLLEHWTPNLRKTNQIYLWIFPQISQFSKHSVVIRPLVPLHRWPRFLASSRRPWNAWCLPNPKWSSNQKFARFSSTTLFIAIFRKLYSILVFLYFCRFRILQ